MRLVRSVLRLVLLLLPLPVAASPAPPSSGVNEPTAELRQLASFLLDRFTPGAHGVRVGVEALLNQRANPPFPPHPSTYLPNTTSCATRNASRRPPGRAP